ncbi:MULTISPECIES: ribosome small subunit-dependent GTPase A [Corynebacterium]|uniref:ribosome small subunit-dependent GTPase A n=1 Tax=Corynebacterium TaxID=1716 RepID=UPI00083640FD|nr:MULTISPECIES: ribosome small subunit-dependent GTPase A [Corynebacterium]MCI1256365.1 ribosome small subunit-dependent GTPase A [Corynebacterium provencense]
MARRRYDESDVKVRPGRGSRPRTKDRPTHRDAETGMVVTKDRGRWGVVLDGAAPDTPPAICMRARELGRTPVVVGDRVAVVGDTSGRDGTLARIVRLEERRTVLRRTADDTDPYERIVVANADQLLIVTAVADPPPRSGFVERALIAAYAGGLTPVLCLTKSDLADPSDFASEFTDLDVKVIVCGRDDPLDPVEEVVRGHLTALIGHSGVGKSTLVNRLVPDADRATGAVSGVGKGRHTSTQSVVLRLPDPADTGKPGWIVDTPGIRSFGLAHVDPDTVIDAFEDLRDVIADCPRGCSHLGPPSDPECALDRLTGASARRVTAVRTLLGALRSNNDWEL